MNKRYKAYAVLVVGLGLFLSACGGIRQVTPVAVYDFGLTSGQPGPEGMAGIALEVRSPPWFDSLGVDYRLAYDDPLRPREYANARWAANPGVLLARRLVQQFGVSGVVGDTAAACLLRIELQEFSQVFDSPAASRGVIQAKLALVDGKRRTLAEKPVTVAVVAKTPDARGGVGALVLAVHDFQQVVAAWLAESRVGGAGPTCRAPGLAS